MRHFKGKVFLIILLFSCIRAYSDSAQPGVWSAGGMSDFTLMYPADSIAFKKIQMKKEFVSIQLYKGFAVVKGEYWMYNTTKDTFRIKTGYPLNAVFNSESQGLRTDIAFDSLTQLRVFIDGQEARIISEPNSGYNENIFWRSGNDNWYVWVTEFKPMGYVKLDVYFIVNTNNSELNGGGYFNKAVKNGFIYILESGATWKQPIEEGTVLVQLQDGLVLNDINGVMPDSIFTWNEKNRILKYSFKNLSPTGDNNIVITYYDNINGFDFGKVAGGKQTYYASIDKLSGIQLNNLQFSFVKFNSPISTSVKSHSLALIIGAICLAVVIFILGFRARRDS